MSDAEMGPTGPKPEPPRRRRRKATETAPIGVTTGSTESEPVRDDDVPDPFSHGLPIRRTFRSGNMPLVS